VGARRFEPRLQTRPGRPLRVAVVGLGRVGTACARALAGAQDLALGAIARRPERISEPLPPDVPASVVRCEAGTLREVDPSLVEALRKALERGGFYDV